MPTKYSRRRALKAKIAAAKDRFGNVPLPVPVQCHECREWVEAGHVETPLGRVWQGVCVRRKAKMRSYESCGKGVKRGTQG